MSAPVSVVIPVLDAADRIGPTLSTLTEGLMEGVIAELVLADGGSADDIAGLAEAVGADLIAAPRGRGTQLAAGADATRAPWLLFLHADTVLSPGWARAVAAHLEQGRDCAGYFRLRFQSPAAMARVVERWANLRARLFGLPYGDQGLLIHRDLYARLGGYPALPLMEDVALARRLGRRRLRALASDAVTSAERYERDGWLLRGWRNLSTLVLYFLGVSPERLAQRYERR